MTHGPWKGRTYGGGSVVADASGRVLEILRDRDTDVRVVELPIARRSSNHKIEVRKSKLENQNRKLGKAYEFAASHADNSAPSSQWGTGNGRALPFST
jgi:hypothetical protein